MEKRTLIATTRSLSRKEYWEKQLEKIGVEYEIETQTCVTTWFEFKIQVNIAGDLNYGKILNAICIPDEMVVFSYKE